MFTRRLDFERVPPAIAERVELFDITEFEFGLFLHPGAQADFERAVLHRIEGAKGKRIPAARAVRLVMRHDEDFRFVVQNGDDGGIEPDDDGLVGAHRGFGGGLDGGLGRDLGHRV